SRTQFTLCACTDHIHLDPYPSSSAKAGAVALYPVVNIVCQFEELLHPVLCSATKL
ncbi:hypothetical protein FRB95_004123, partial [Tulasnella sp. JGI-2019a]